MEFVDILGMNVIECEYEVLMCDYVLCFDFVFFVILVDWLFMWSECDFFESIKEWGKKIVFVVNKVDIL